MFQGRPKKGQGRVGEQSHLRVMLLAGLVSHYVTMQQQQSLPEKCYLDVAAAPISALSRCMYLFPLQLSVLRLFHQLLSDPSLRTQPETKEVLLLATRVVRGLFSKLAPPPPAPPTAPQQNGDGDEVEQQTAAAAAAAAGGSNGSGDAQRQKEKEEREVRRRSAVSGMLCVELLFWKHPVTVDQINREYSLREDDRWVWW